MIALGDWTVTAGQWTIGQLAMIYLLTLVVGIGRFAHCVAGSCEVGPLSSPARSLSPLTFTGSFRLYGATFAAAYLSSACLTTAR
jgi:formate/nitrite transporter FocA (FNT family)